MKKAIATLMICLLILSMTACSSNSSKETSAAEANTTSTASETEISESDSADAPAESTSVAETAPVETGSVTGDTIGSKYLSVFSNSSADTAKASVEELIAANIFETELVEMEVSEGYLDGFSADITGFSAGSKFSPMIGSIPFVGYVLETEDPDTLLNTLAQNADPAWNICTEADETVSGTRGNLVFFLMCTNEE